jgi:Fic family protein
MIVSVKPPYDITPKILRLVSSVSGKLGEVNASYLNRPSPLLRKQNRIKTIHSSLGIEGNTLSNEQVTAIIENKRVNGPEKDITEVLNAIKAYERLQSYDPCSVKSFLQAHKILMKGLAKDPGKFRNQGVGIFQGSGIAHIAPPAENVPFLMKDLLRYLENEDELCLIKACVFHYETEFIHPFTDGNGRMGRLWQTVILMREYPVFEFLPVETLISRIQHDYYEALAKSDSAGNSVPFIEYMLAVIDNSLTDLLDYNSRILSDTDRMEYFKTLGKSEFTRKDYMNVFKDISTATASRDLKKATDKKILERTGNKNQTVYRSHR